MKMKALLECIESYGKLHNPCFCYLDTIPACDGQRDRRICYGYNRTLCCKQYDMLLKRCWNEVSNRSTTAEAQWTDRTLCVGFHRSQGSSPLWGSSTGGWRMDMQTSPF